MSYQSFLNSRLAIIDSLTYRSLLTKYSSIDEHKSSHFLNKRVNDIQVHLVNCFAQSNLEILW